MPATRIQLVCFDLGGVLVRICRRWQQSCQRIGMAIPAALADQSIWQQRPDLFVGFEAGRFDEDEFFKLTGLALPTVGAANMRRIYEAWLLGLYDGVDDLLAKLAARRITTACLSNTNPTHWRQLDDPHGDYAPLQRLDHRWASHLLGEIKPNDGAFAHVERQLNLSGEAIVFFDDDRDNVAAARRRGWRAVLVDPADPIPQVAAHLRECGLL